MRTVRQLAEALSGRALNTRGREWQVSVQLIGPERIGFRLSSGHAAKEIQIQFEGRIWREDRIWGVDWNQIAEWLLLQIASRVEERPEQDPLYLALGREGLNPCHRS